MEILLENRLKNLLNSYFLPEIFILKHKIAFSILFMLFLPFAFELDFFRMIFHLEFINYYLLTFNKLIIKGN